MGFIKQGAFLCLLFFHHLLACQLSQKTLLDTEFRQKLTLKEGEKKGLVSVNRRGGGGGGHGGGHAGGHAGGSHGEGHGGNGGHEGQGRGALIPLYVAGAGAYHHGTDRHHHGSNSASRGYCGLCYLALSIFISLVFVCFI